MELSVVVPLFNGARFLPDLLQSLGRQEWSGSWELVIADNGSTDEGPEVVERFRQMLPRTIVVDASMRRGPAYARNAGVRAAGGSSLVFVDADDAVGPGFVAAMGEALREHEFVCAYLDVEDLNPRWTWQLRPSPQFDGPADTLHFLPFSGGGTMGIRRSLFEAMRGFDEEMLITEDIDLSWRAQVFGGAEVVLVREAVLHVRNRATLAGIFAQARSWGRAEYRLQREYRQYGARPAPLRARYRPWCLIVRHLPRLRHQAGRAWWLTQFGNSLGRLEAGAASLLRRRSIRPALARGCDPGYRGYTPQVGHEDL